MKNTDGWLWQEGRPKDSGEYLVFFQERRTVLYFTGKRWLWGDGSHMSDSYQKMVTAWAFLPDNPQIKN